MRRLHLIRGAAPPAGAVAEHDWLVYDRGPAWELAPQGAPPRPAGLIDHDALLALVLAADLVITW